MGPVQHPRLVPGDVDPGRALGGARLAGQAEIQRLGDGGGARRVDQRAVRQLLQHPGPAPGGVLFAPGHLERRAHRVGGPGRHTPPNPGAAVHVGGQTVERVRQQRQPQVGVQGRRPDQDAGVEQVVGVEEPFDGREQGQRGRRVHPRQQLRTGPAVAVLARHRPTVGGGQVGGRLDEPPVGGRAARLADREVDPAVHAALAEVPVGQAVQPVPGEQRLEVPQVGAEPCRRDGGVLPPGMRRTLQCHPGIAGGVGPQPPPGRRGRRIGHHRSERGRKRRQLAGLRGNEPRVVPGQFDEQPPPARRQQWCRADSRRPRPRPPQHRIDDAGIQPLAGAGGEAQHLRHGVRGVRQRVEAECHQDGVRRITREPDGRPPHHRERALGADQEAGHVEALLGQQVLQGIARHLAPEAAELGADHAEVGGHQVAQRPHGRRPITPRVIAEPEREPLPGSGDHVQPGDHVAGAAVAECPRPAGVVADHPADGAAGRRGRVRAEPQAVRASGGGQVGLDDSGLHHGDPGRGVERLDPVQPPGVDHQPRTDRVARAGRPGAPHGDRQSSCEGEVDGGVQPGEVVGHEDGVGGDAVERGVGGVEGAAQRGAVKGRGAHPVSLPPRGRRAWRGRAPRSRPDRRRPPASRGPTRHGSGRRP